VNGSDYYTASAVRELDRLAIEKHQIPGFELMMRAGTAAYKALMHKWPTTRELAIFCGTGNNGGDGFIVAALALSNGLQVEIYVAGKLSSITGDARKALDYAESRQASITSLAGSFKGFAEFKARAKNMVLIDALLGTGLKGHVREPFKEIIHLINTSNLPVLAIDIPSGLCSDTGEILGSAIKADLTVTFIGRKIGLVIAHGPEQTGELIFNSLDVPPEIYAQVKPAPFKS
tara:strand:- start:2117 stop:2812 length:696 start_codon:yes stop_codon:yes gene_type:complete